MKKSSSAASMLLLAVSMLVFGTVGVFRKYVPSVSSVTLAFIRGTVGAIFLFILSALGRRRLFRKTDKKKLLLLILSGALIGLNWLLLFESFNYTTVSVGTLFYYTEPTLVVLASAVLFKEKLTVKKILCTCAAFVGMIFVSGIVEGGIPSGGVKGIALAFGAALLYTTVVLLNKKVTGVDAYEKTIVQLAAAAAVLIPIIIADAVRTGENPFPTGAKEILLSLAMGIIHTGIAYAMYFASMENLTARTVALFSYIDPVTALVLSFTLLGEPMTVLSITGAVLIIGSAAVCEFTPEIAKNKRQNKPKTEQKP